MDEGVVLHHGTEDCVNLLKCHHFPLISGIQQFMRFVPESFLPKKQVSRRHGIVQCKLQCTTNPHRIVRRTACFPGNFIYGFETESADRAQFKGTVLQNIHGLCTEFFLYPDTFFYRHTVRRQVGNNISDAFALGVGIGDAFQLLFRDSFHCEQFLRLFFDDLQCFHAKSIHNQFCCFAANAFDQSGRKIGGNPVFCLRNDLHVAIHRKLQSVFVLLPVSVQIHINGSGGGQTIADCGKADQLISPSEGTSCITGYCFILCFERGNHESGTAVFVNHFVKCAYHP